MAFMRQAGTEIDRNTFNGAGGSTLRIAFALVLLSFSAIPARADAFGMPSLSLVHVEGPVENGGPLFHANPNVNKIADCTWYKTRSRDGWVQVRAQPSLDSRPLWRIVAGSIIAKCDRRPPVREGNIPWVWIKFSSLNLLDYAPHPPPAPPAIVPSSPPPQGSTTAGLPQGPAPAPQPTSPAIAGNDVTPSNQVDLTAKITDEWVKTYQHNLCVKNGFPPTCLDDSWANNFDQVVAHRIMDGRWVSAVRFLGLGSARAERKNSRRRFRRP